VQLALPSDSKTAHVSRLMIAGVAVAGASLFAMNAPTPAGPQVQHRAVTLAATEVDWSTVISDAEANLTTGMSDLNNLSSDVFGAFVNGYDAGTNPFNGAEDLFPGLLNDGSLLQSLLVTWPEQFVTALGTLGA
jgi:hypothetical protein